MIEHWLVDERRIYNGPVIFRKAKRYRYPVPARTVTTNGGSGRSIYRASIATRGNKHALRVHLSRRSLPAGLLTDLGIFGGSHTNPIHL